MDGLPLELVAHILSLVREPDVRLVCREWRDWLPPLADLASYCHAFLLVPSLVSLAYLMPPPVRKWYDAFPGKNDAFDARHECGYHEDRRYRTHQCMSFTSSGRLCRRKARAVHRLCGVHRSRIPVWR